MAKKFSFKRPYSGRSFERPHIIREIINRSLQYGENLFYLDRYDNLIQVAYRNQYYIFKIIGCAAKYKIAYDDILLDEYEWLVDHFPITNFNKDGKNNRPGTHLSDLGLPHCDEVKIRKKLSDMDRYYEPLNNFVTYLDACQGKDRIICNDGIIFPSILIEHGKTRNVLIKVEGNKNTVSCIDYKGTVLDFNKKFELTSLKDEESVSNLLNKTLKIKITEDGDVFINDELVYHEDITTSFCYDDNCDVSGYNSSYDRKRFITAALRNANIIE